MIYTEFEKEYHLLEAIERLTPLVFEEVKHSGKVICANIDMYSGFVYRMLGIPEELFTPLFAVSRMAGWCAHRFEEMVTGKRIIRPAYKSVMKEREYVPIDER
jgi:citrate synthase